MTTTRLGSEWRAVEGWEWEEENGVNPVVVGVRWVRSRAMQVVLMVAANNVLMSIQIQYDLYLFQPQ